MCLGTEISVGSLESPPRRHDNCRYLGSPTASRRRFAKLGGRHRRHLDIRHLLWRVMVTPDPRPLVKWLSCTRTSTSTAARHREPRSGRGRPDTPHWARSPPAAPPPPHPRARFGLRGGHHSHCNAFLRRMIVLEKVAWYTTWGSNNPQAKGCLARMQIWSNRAPRTRGSVLSGTLHRGRVL